MGRRGPDRLGVGIDHTVLGGDIGFDLFFDPFRQIPLLIDIDALF